MASEPPLILAFDTSAAHCAAALVRGDAVLARARRADGPRPGRAPAADARGAAGRGRRCAGPTSTRIARLHRPGQLHRPPRSRSPRRAASRSASASRRSASRVFEALARPARRGAGDARGHSAAASPRPSRRHGAPLAASRRSARRARPLPGSRRRIAGGSASSPAPSDARRSRRRSRGSPRAGSTAPTPPAPLYLRPADAMPPSEPRAGASSMTPEALAALHALAFTDTPRPWTASRVRGAARARRPTLLAARAGGFAARPRRRPGGRAPDPRRRIPSARRRGLGARARRAPSRPRPRRAAPRRRCSRSPRPTPPARALYAALGYAPVGRRPGYYRRAGGAAGRRAGAAQARSAPARRKTI